MAITDRRMIGVFGPLYDSNIDNQLDAADRTVLMAHGIYSGIYALDARSGEPVWSHPNRTISSIGTLINLDSDVDSEYVHFEQDLSLIHI